MQTDDRVYYHGCFKESGHFLYDDAGRRLLDSDSPFSFKKSLDGGFCHSSEYGERQGRAKLTYVKGWTVLAFWDRSMDARGACNSAFVADGKRSFDGMRRLAERHFPDVWKRVTSAFEVVLWEPPPDHFFYFGCWGRSGHNLHRPNGSTVYRQGPKAVKLPWKYIDGVLQPHAHPMIEKANGNRHVEFVDNDLQVQSLAALRQKDGWTVLAMWDRTVDTRYGCNSNFFMKGKHTYDEMRALAQEHFPSIWKRINAAAPVTFFGRMS